MPVLDLIFNRMLPDSAKLLVISAHPDDEVLGLSSVMFYHKNIYLIHTTDGAPEDMADARRLGLNSREEYSKLRFKEFTDIINLTEIPAGNNFRFNIIDQQSPFNLVELTKMLLEKIHLITPDIIFTHPYEGGHPDHDSASFAVHAAIKLFEKRTGQRPELLEFTSYFQVDGEFRTGEFIPYPGSTERCIKLNESEKEFKSRLIRIYESQKELLKNMPLEYEVFRTAPDYDFLSLPHKEILYDNFPWGVKSNLWLDLTENAFCELGLKEIK